MNWLCVFIGGGIGALARYGVTLLGAGSENKFLFTLLVNVVGSFLIGVLASVLASSGASRSWSLFAVTGLLGGFTTFSAFALEAVSLASGGRLGMALLYAAGSVVVGLAACALGIWLTSLTRQALT